ncbi:MAG: AbrB/MazE/SpoVT family DNA-binding domain-containing protein [Patescibacteria group bacterium]
MRKIFKTGHSLAVTLSKKVLEDLGWKEGDRVEVNADADHRRVIIKPVGHREQLSLGIKVRPSFK